MEDQGIYYNRLFSAPTYELWRRHWLNTVQNDQVSYPKGFLSGNGMDYIISFGDIFIELPEGTSILDIGCGDANGISQLQNMYPALKFAGINMVNALYGWPANVPVTVAAGELLCRNELVEWLDALSMYPPGVVMSRNTMYLNIVAGEVITELGDLLLQANFHAIIKTLQLKGIFLIYDNVFPPRVFTDKYLEIIRGMNLPVNIDIVQSLNGNDHYIKITKVGDY